MEIKKSMTLQEIIGLPCFSQMEGQFFASAGGDWMKDKKEMSLIQLQQQNPTWFHEDVIYGLNRLQEIALKGGQYVYPLSEGVNLIHMAAKEKKYDSYAILAAGGGYGVVCTMVEALPVAARLNELGMDCFCLNYRTATKSSFIDGLMPKPLDDMASAWRYIKTREGHFGVHGESYIAGGFSAGGHLCAMWGTPHLGARSYGIPSPQMLLLAYPLVTTENLQGSMAEIMCDGMLGVGRGQEKIEEYGANHHVDIDYPPVYLVQAMDDSAVPQKDSRDLEAALKAADIRCNLERVETGGHGFGLGSDTQARGWVERALAFMENERNGIS